MLYQHPEVFWALLLLLIPIVIHLFQLRRFKVTPFTNVRILERILSKSRKSSRLKKWLLLITRLLLLSALIFAFAKPFIPPENGGGERETWIYIDNSLSMQYPENNGTLLSNAIQDLLQNVPEDFKLQIFTNDRVFKDKRYNTLRRELLSLGFTSNQLSLEEIYLKASSLFSKDPAIEKSLWMISDGEDFGNAVPDSLWGMDILWYNSSSPSFRNISLDSAYLTEAISGQRELDVLLSMEGEVEIQPISLYDGNTLIAKTAPELDENNQLRAVLTLPEQKEIQGVIRLNDGGLPYDNQLFLSIAESPKIKVLCIGEGDTDFLRRIYTEDEFEYTVQPLDRLNYGELEQQDLIVLNQLAVIPNSLAESLRIFVQNGGSLIAVPDAEIDLIVYNRFLNSISTLGYNKPIQAENFITRISYDHPIYRGVFEERITNFEYPKVNQYFSLQGNYSPVLSYQNGEVFLANQSNTYVFTAALSRENSNFIEAPLIVPTFYSIGKLSLKQNELYYETSAPAVIDVPVQLQKDQVLEVRNNTEAFIPRQQSFTDRVRVYFDTYPSKAGSYTLMQNSDSLLQISFNYPRIEKVQNPQPSSQWARREYNDLYGLISDVQKEGKITVLWKWFVILALIFVTAEILLQKLLK